VDTRRSSSKPDRGIVTVRLSLVRNEDEVVMSHLDTILVRRRFPLGWTPRRVTAPSRRSGAVQM